MIDWLIAPITTFIVTVWGLTRKWAKAKYETAIDEMETVKTARGTAEQLARDPQKIIDGLKSDLQAERDKSPKAFLQTLATHRRDGMWEHEVRDSRSYIERQKTALHRAFRTIAREHIETALDHRIAAVDEDPAPGVRPGARD